MPPHFTSLKTMFRRSGAKTARSRDRSILRIGSCTRSVSTVAMFPRQSTRAELYRRSARFSSRTGWTMHGPGDADGSEHQEQVIPRAGDPFHPLRLERVDRLAEEPGDGQPDHLGHDEEDDEEHDLGAPALRMPPEGRVELRHTASGESITHCLTLIQSATSRRDPGLGLVFSHHTPDQPVPT